MKRSTRIIIPRETAEWLLARHDQKSWRWNLIDIFGDVSGLRLNRKKAESLWIGTKAISDFQLLPEKGFKWSRNKVKALGVWLSTDRDITISQNYNDKLEKINAILGCWKFRRLSLLGKITVLKSLLASQLVYI